MTTYFILLAILLLVPLAYWLISQRPARTRPSEAAASAGDLKPMGTEASTPRMRADTADDAEDLESPNGRLPREGKLALLGDLAAGIAHEINNPVAIVLEEAGWIEDLLEEEELQNSPNVEEFRRALKQIKTQGARCKDIIQNLLTFGRKGSVKVQDVQLNDLIRDAVKSHEKRIRAGNIEIRTHLADNLPTCRLSPSEMQQILSNLINNAADALASKGGSIEVASRFDGQDVLIDVADNGPGMPREILGRIFDPFFTTKPVGKGTGLGLSICYSLVERIGGAITVESAVGIGSSFHVRIPAGGQPEPRLKAALAGPQLVEEEESGGGLPTAPATTAVVLVVDDEVAFIEALQKRLRKRGLQIYTAFSGEEALDKIKLKREIEVVVLGVKMSGMDGIQTLREIKGTRPLVEVILLSAHSTVESAIEGIKQGAFDYLLKPCDMAQLVDQISRAKRRKDRQEQKIMEARIKEITSRRI